MMGLHFHVYVVSQAELITLTLFHEPWPHQAQTSRQWCQLYFMTSDFHIFRVILSCVSGQPVTADAGSGLELQTLEWALRLGGSHPAAGAGAGSWTAWLPLEVPVETWSDWTGHQNLDSMSCNHWWLVILGGVEMLANFSAVLWNA